MDNKDVIILTAILFHLFLPGWTIQNGSSIYGNLANAICGQRRDLFMDGVLQKSLKIQGSHFFNNPLLCLLYKDGEFDASLCRQRMILQTISGSLQQERIHKGYDALLGQFPWMVSLAYTYYDGSMDVLIPFCGGSLIGDKWVLTAAHCLIEVPVSEARAVLGTIFVNQDHTPSRQVINVRTYYKHPEYRKRGLLNDIGLVELERFPKKSRYVKEIEIHPRNFNQNNIEALTIAGWGRLYEDGYGSNVLKYMVRNTTSNTKCQKILEGSWDLQENTLCTVPTYGSNACPGDSGSPAIFETYHDEVYRIVGIVSNYRGHCDNQTTEVYSDATKHIDFIRTIIGHDGRRQNLKS